MSNPSIYRTPEGEAELMTLYDRAVARLGLKYEDRMVDTRFGPAHLLVTGPEKAPPVFMLHGGNATNPVTLAWYVPLTKMYRVYAPDTVGHPGKSAQTRLSPKDHSFGQWVVDILDALSLEQASFIGPSYGAGIILRTAAYAPERIAKAVLHVPSGVAHGSLSRMILELALPMLLYRWFPSRERLLRAVRPLAGAEQEIDELMLQTTGAVFRHLKLETALPKLTTRAELENFKAPTLVLAAEHDLLFPAKVVLPRAQEIIPNLTAAERLEGGHHFPSAQEQVYIQRRIQRFLEEGIYL